MLSTGELKSTPIFSNICVSALGAIFKLMPHFGDRGAPLSKLLPAIALAQYL